MTLPTLSELQAKWDIQKSEILKHPKANQKSRKALKPLLAECIDAGKYIADPIDRANLQWIAREIGDAIFWITSEYPNTAISPTEPSLSAEPSAPAVTGAASKLRIYNVPHPRNPFFTGREEVLQQLHKTISASRIASLSGLGGIGKTQTAVEYAYRHRDDYSAVLWVGADTRELLVSGFVALAGND
jgi:hypothetical protein